MIIRGLVCLVAGLADVLEAMAGNDPVVVVGGDQADGRVQTRGLLLEVVVERGDLPEVVELLLHVASLLP